MLRWLFNKNLKALRLAAYFVSVFLLLSLFAARALHAQVNEAALALGRELAGLGELSKRGHTILLNGARLHYARTITEQPLERVLDQLEAYCDTNSGYLGEELGRISRAHPHEFDEHFPEGSLRRGVTEQRSDDAGMVLCLARPSGASEGLISSLRKFIETSNLSELGLIRYLYAERLASGKTRVILFWNNGPLDLDNMFPAVGDASGSDSRVLPRPPESRRTLSAAVEGMPYAVRTYASNRNIDQVKQFYQLWMEEQHWQLGAEAEGTLTYFRPDGYQAFVSLVVQDGLTFTTLTEAGRSNGPSIQRVEVRK